MFGKTPFPIPFFVVLWWHISIHKLRFAYGELFQQGRGRGWPPDVDTMLDASWYLPCCKQPINVWRRRRGWLLCYTHPCLQEEMRQRFKSEIGLTRIGECLLSKNNNRLITCDRTCEKKSWDGWRSDANIWLLNYPRWTKLKRTRMLSNVFECFRMNAFLQTEKRKNSFG